MHNGQEFAYTNSPNTLVPQADDGPIPTNGAAASGETLVPPNSAQYNERLRWQAMLASAIRTEIVTRQVGATTDGKTERDTFMSNLWITLRAHRLRRSVRVTRAQLGALRKKISELPDELKAFRCTTQDKHVELTAITTLFTKLDDAACLFPSHRAFQEHVPELFVPPLSRKVDALQSWQSIMAQIQVFFQAMRFWSNVDMSSPHANLKALQESSKFVMFDPVSRKSMKRVLTHMLNTMLLIENYSADYKGEIVDMKLPSLQGFSMSMCLITSKMATSVLSYLCKEAFALPATANYYVLERIATAIKGFYLRMLYFHRFYVTHDLDAFLEVEFGAEQMEGIKRALDAYLVILLKMMSAQSRIVVDHSEGDILERAWPFLMDIAPLFEDKEAHIALKFCEYANQLVQMLPLHLQRQVDSEPSLSKILGEGQMRLRKLYHFQKFIVGYMENAVEYRATPEMQQALVSMYAQDATYKCFRSTQPNNSWMAFLPHEMDISDAFEYHFNRADASTKVEPYLFAVFLRTTELPSSNDALALDADVQLSEGWIRLVPHSKLSLASCKQFFETLCYFNDISLDAYRRVATMQPVDVCLRTLEKAVLDVLRFFRHFYAIIAEKSSTLDLEPVKSYMYFLANITWDYAQQLTSELLVDAQLLAIQHAMSRMQFMLGLKKEGDPNLRATMAAFETLLKTVNTEGLLHLSLDEFDQLRDFVSCTLSMLLSDTIPTSFHAHLPKQAWRSEETLVQLDKQRQTVMEKQRLAGKIIEQEAPENSGLLFLASSKSTISQRWQKSRFLGSGTFGSVYLAVDVDSGGLMAVKQIKLQEISQLSQGHRNIKDEMSVMERLSHPNIVQYYGMEVHRDHVNIFMEYCAGGSLGEVLKSGAIQDTSWIKTRVREMLHGLAYLHAHSIVHRDIKPDNLLLDEHGSVKLVDFGTALNASSATRSAKTSNGNNAGLLAGTPMYMAPEVIKGLQKTNPQAMDIWSVGCCALEMLTGKRPWHYLDNDWAIMYHIATGRPAFPDELDKEATAFLEACFTQSPADRPTAKGLLEHAWIQM